MVRETDSFSSHPGGGCDGIFIGTNKRALQFTRRELMKSHESSVRSCVTHTCCRLPVVRATDQKTDEEGQFIKMAVGVGGSRHKKREVACTTLSDDKPRGKKKKEAENLRGKRQGQEPVRTWLNRRQLEHQRPGRRIATLGPLAERGSRFSPLNQTTSHL
jgi:hypothetical protein